MPKTPHATDVHVASRLRQARLMAGLSQEAVAKKLGLSFQQLQKYEKGINRVSASRLHHLACLLGRPVAWFFEGLAEPDDKRATIDPLVEFGTSDDAIRLASDFNRISDPGARRVVTELARVMANAEQIVRNATRSKAA